MRAEGLTKLAVRRYRLPARDFRCSTRESLSWPHHECCCGRHIISRSTCADKPDVVWFYERGGSYIRCETRDGDRPGLYELVVVDAAGNERVERFANSESLLRRQHELESTLQTDGWQGPFGRFF